MRLIESFKKKKLILFNIFLTLYVGINLLGGERGLVSYFEKKKLSLIYFFRGIAREQLDNYEQSMMDLRKALEFVPEQPQVLNYLGYSWLERGYKIKEAIDMLDNAYNQKKNDPYIIDSVGWGYYLIGDFINAEIFLRKAIQLMPKDPIVNDHYGDVLWMLNRKIQARYFWNNALKQEDTEKEMKKKIEEKLLNGISNL